MKEEILRLQNVEKSYYDFKVLENINMILFKGNILGIVGGNGAGKSTLAKILSGDLRYDKGNIYIDEKKVCISSIADARKFGIVCIYQECSLVEEMTVAENLFLIRIKKPAFINEDTLYQKAQKYLDYFDLPLSPSALVGNLSQNECRKLELVKAFTDDVKILILDELGSSMNAEDKIWVRRQIIRMKEKGLSFIVISHDLDEIVRISDYTMVMRDGHVVRVLSGKQNQLSYIIQSMLIEENKRLCLKKEFKKSKERLCLENVETADFKNINFTVNSGEIVGVYSVSENLANECSSMLYGLKICTNGNIYIDNKKVFITDPRIAVKKGIALIMGKNEGDSLFPEFSIGDNITFPVLGRTSKFGFRNKKFEAIIENESIKGVNFSDNMKDKLIIELSGGQKQKVLLAKSIAMNCKIYVINNAMANVDYITRIALYNKLFELRSEGKAILFFSRDYEELKMISDRIYVTKNNTVVEEY